MAFLACDADLAFTGGGGGGGKTWSLLAEAARWIEVPGYTAVLFRKTFPQIKNAGGLWDSAFEIYPKLGGEPKQSMMDWIFPPHSNCIQFRHMQHEKNKKDWDGAQVAMFGFDQVEQFSWSQFSYISFSRGRSTSGIRPYVRATCNPDPDSWLRSFLSWWIDDETGLAIPERSGVIRWFIVSEDRVIWGATPEELMLEHGADCDPMSCTFIPASIYDNKILMEKDPGYIGKLKKLPQLERERLLDGNWNAKPAPGSFFNRNWFEVVSASPAVGECCRGWDLAGEEGSAFYTVGVKVRRTAQGVLYVEDVVRKKVSSLGVEQLLLNTSTQDGPHVHISIPKDPGQAGSHQIRLFRSLLARFGDHLHFSPETGSKIIRAKPYSAQAEQGNVKLVRAPWNRAFLDEHDSFGPGSTAKVKDQVDATARAVNYLLTHSRGSRLAAAPRLVVLTGGR